MYGSRLAGALRTGKPPGERLANAADFVVEWGSKEDTWRFQREAWALALHDPVVDSIVGKVYEDGFQALRELFLEIKPNASEEQLKTAATVFGLFSEGTLVLNSNIYGFITSPPEVIDAMISSVMTTLGVPAGEKT
jgi:hypothetical protein